MPSFRKNEYEDKPQSSPAQAGSSEEHRGKRERNVASNLKNRLRLIRESRSGKSGAVGGSEPAVGDGSDGTAKPDLATPTLVGEFPTHPGLEAADGSRSGDTPAKPAAGNRELAADGGSDSIAKSAPDAAAPGSPTLPGWTSAGYQTLMRTVTRELPPFPAELPRALAILVPDLLRYAALAGGIALVPATCNAGFSRPGFSRQVPRTMDMPAPEDLLFFDLETTGLSGGAGTVAFLAAFGRFVKTGPNHGDAGASDGVEKSTAYSLVTTQYLLLDYPGEPDFLDAVLGEIGAPGTFYSGTAPNGTITGDETGFNERPGMPPLVVSYNGKSFDSQILRNRCLMNGLMPPELHQADLLHPARRLWKRLLPSCSQGEIESSVLGLDRSGDIPGALAPDIWFSFLKNGETGDLLGICDHNLRDIQGLASLFIALARLAADPHGESLLHDRENLALWWRRMIRIHGEAVFGEGAAEIGEALLARAAEAGQPRAAHTYYRKLAIDAEWKRKDNSAALGYVDTFLALREIQDSIRGEMIRRRERLLEKLKTNGGSHEYTDSDH